MAEYSTGYFESSGRFVLEGVAISIDGKEGNWTLTPRLVIAGTGGLADRGSVVWYDVEFSAGNSAFLVHTTSQEAASLRHMLNWYDCLERFEAGVAGPCDFRGPSDSASIPPYWRLRITRSVRRDILICYEARPPEVGWPYHPPHAWTTFPEDWSTRNDIYSFGNNTQSVGEVSGHSLFLTAASFVCGENDTHVTLGHFRRFLRIINNA